MSETFGAGSMLPDIAMTTPEGGTVKPSDFIGQKLVIPAFEANLIIRSCKHSGCAGENFHSGL